jgi:alkylhydroperoxidase/carboxymuconolactone decarboxylase family protein YurZ
MDEQTKALIGLGAAAASGCLHCIEGYIARCDELEVPREDVVDALEVALSVREGARDTIRKDADHLLGDYPQEAA